MVDYSVMDRCFKVPSWDSRHPHDIRRFHESLAKIIHEDGFHPEEMGGYIHQSLGVSPTDPSSAIIDRYVNDAWAVHGYLKAVSR